MSAVRALEFKTFGDLLTGNKGLTTNFALILAITTIVVVKIMMRGTAKRTSGIFRDRLAVASLNRFDLLLILPFIVGQQKLPILFYKGNDGGKDIGLKFLIFG